ncbi:Flp pilus assembly protein CpaB [Streptomyces aurantiacus]|uniref:SAF domain-containing protein n=1 Tax=Streptomyces aurantiacus TaxID=47760 RepID=UPI0027921AD6|nr:SAF domain-containing protein [Streptomyces aurantiacus]MDQ0772959.1 Flp pilus assembly protein CpaB [Streptomyces aurantiacus]
MARRRSLPYLLLGVLLVLGCATGGVVVAIQLGHREDVLVLAHPVAVGQKLSPQDVREVSISVDSNLAVIPARSRSQVQGRAVAYTLPAGALLTRDVLGDARVPPPGQAVAAVGLKDGQYPPELQPGNRVTVVAATSDTSTGSRQSRSSTWNATVTGVHSSADDQVTAVSLQMAQDDARRLAAVPTGQISVVMVHGGER